MQTPAGWLKGSLSLRRTGTLVSGDLRLNLSGLKLPLGGGVLSGQVSGDVAVSGSGDSPAALMESLAGGGTLQHTGIGIGRLDPEALSRTVAALIAPEADTAPEKVAERFEQEIAKGALSLPSGEATATVAQGVLRLSPLRMPTAAGEVLMTIGADIAHQRSEAKADYQLAQAPDKWSGRPPAATVFWSGSLLLPDRHSDTTVLSNGLAAIAIARDLERIQIYEQDARERAFFVRRQRASDQERRRLEEEKRKAEEARKAEDDARREAARRADEEARRQAEQARRQLEEDKRRAEEAARREAARRAEQQSQPPVAAPSSNVAPPLDLTGPSVTPQP